MVFILETIHSLRNDERTTQSVTLIMIGGFFMPKNKFQDVIKFLGENPGACPWDEAKKYFSKSLMSISSEYTLQI